MFDLDKEVKKIKKMQKVELKERKDDKKFTRSSLDDALSVGILRLALKTSLNIKDIKNDWWGTLETRYYNWNYMQGGINWLYI